MFGILGFVAGRIPWWVYALAVALAVTAGTGLYLEHQKAIKKAAFDAGVAEDKARSDGVIAKMILTHAENVAKENAKVDALIETLQKVKQGAQDALRTANAATAKIRAAFAAVSGERDKLRDDLTRAIVTGGVQASDDSVSACRDRADRSAKVLQESLRVSAVCAGDATDEVARGNALYESWLQLERATGM